MVAGVLLPPADLLSPAEPVTFQRLESSYAGAPAFRYTRSQSFDIFDINQKCFVLESPTQLVALHLQGPSSSQKGDSTTSLSLPPVPVPTPYPCPYPLSLSLPPVPAARPLTRPFSPQ